MWFPGRHSPDLAGPGAVGWILRFSSGASAEARIKSHKGLCSVTITSLSGCKAMLDLNSVKTAPDKASKAGDLVTMEISPPTIPVGAGNFV